MLGSYRLMLAMLVIIGHLLPLSTLGICAIDGFFILSGYLMTYVLEKTYSYNFSGRINFMLNRFLRLYPTYWILLAITLIMVVTTNGQITAYHASISLPNTWSSWFENASMIFLDFYPGSAQPRVIPPSWTLTIELFYYLLFVMGIGKTKKSTLIWLCFGIVFMVVNVFQGNANFNGSILGASLPFSIGALAFHYKEKYSSFLAKNTYNTFVLFVLLLGNIAVSELFDWYNDIYQKAFLLIVNYLLNVLLIVNLIFSKKMIISKRLDTILGSFSYPFYLFHWQVAFLVSYFAFNEPIHKAINTESFMLLGLTIVFLIPVGGLNFYFIEKPLEKVRARFKKRSL